MAYVPFTNAYPDNIAGQQRHYARQAAIRNRIAAIFANGNQVMGALTTECCSDPAYGGQDFYANAPGIGVPTVDALMSSLVPASSAAASSQAAASTPPTISPGANYPLTPNDILSNSQGWQSQPNGKPWPRRKLPQSVRRALANAYPNYGPTVPMQSLVPPCPCFGNGPAVTIAVPSIAPAPAPAPAPVPPAIPCPYPGCSTGNVCLDLITGCVSNSQVTQAQVEACTTAGYSVFGNSGVYLSPILVGCRGNLPFLGSPMPNPPPAAGSMENTLATANAAGAALNKSLGLAGLGQDSTFNVGGLLAVLGMFGIVVWAMKK